MFPLKNLARKGLISVQYVKGYYIKLIDRLQKKKKKKKIDRLRLTSVSTKKGHDITWTPPLLHQGPILITANSNNASQSIVTKSYTNRNKKVSHTKKNSSTS